MAVDDDLHRWMYRLVHGESCFANEALKGNRGEGSKGEDNMSQSETWLPERESDQIDNVEASQLPVREPSDGSKTQYIMII